MKVMGREIRIEMLSQCGGDIASKFCKATATLCVNGRLRWSQRAEQRRGKVCKIPVVNI